MRDVAAAAAAVGGLASSVLGVWQGLTEHYLTTSAHGHLIKPGEWMLIHGVAGGTCQWAAQVGFRCHSPTSLSHAAEFLRL